nr:AMP-activated protein kinase beta-1 subunit [uncultured bacterium]
MSRSRFTGRDKKFDNSCRRKAMSDLLISQFIDDELELDEKITFVEIVRDDRRFADETVALLQQEKVLAVALGTAPATMRTNTTPGILRNTGMRSWLAPMAGFVTALLLAGLGFLLHTGLDEPVSPTVATEHRFVLYLPQVSQARIVGSFTGWNPLPMRKIGNSGYWAVTVKVPPGEHRYSYMIDGENRMADPSVATREQDDFGGENSVIVVGEDNAPVS